jgi:molecular chaperone GrpE
MTKKRRKVDIHEAEPATTVIEEESKQGALDKEEVVEALKQHVDQLREEVETYKDRWMRSSAEFENYKKRLTREKEDWIKYGNENLLKAILPIIDNLERALAHAEAQDNCESLQEGIQMIHRQFLTVLDRFGVQRIEALHQPFDPSLHEAMMQVGSDEHEPNTIVQELEKGYLLQDRLLRPTKVAVSKKTEPAPDTNANHNI